MNEIRKIYPVNSNVVIRYIDSGKIIYGTVVGYFPDNALQVDRDEHGLGWVPCDHPNVSIDLI